MTHAVGARARRLDAVAKCTGEARYGGDLAAHMEGVLHIAARRSPHAHARVKGIDSAGALATPGVVAVLPAKDVPGTNMHGLIVRDQEVLARDVVRHTGDAVAVVVAETAAALQAGLAAVQVDYEVLPGVFSIDEAMAPGAPALHPGGNVMATKRIRKGDAAKAFAEPGVVVVEDVFHTQAVDHAFLDREAGVATYDGELLTIHASGQWVHEERRLIALALGLPVERVRIIQPVTGGAFGGREDIGIQIYLGLAAMRTGRPVRIDYSRSESTIARHKRHPLRVHYKLGARPDGTLVAAEVTVYAEKGAYASTGVAVMRKSASHCTGPYRIPHVHCDVIGVYTNHNPNGAMRGFGAAQMAIAYEGMIDRLAAKLGVDRIQLRRQNLVTNGDEVTTRQVIPVVSATECLEAALAKFGWEGRSYDTAKPYLKRGYGVSCVCFGLGYGDGFPDASRARVRFAEDGVLEVYSGAVEVGQGIINMMAQVAAQELGVDPETVRVIAADTHRTPEAGSSSATRQTFFTGNAVYLAATELRKQLLDVGMALIPVHLDELTLADDHLVETHGDKRRVPLATLLAEARKRGYELDAKSHFQPRTVPSSEEDGLSPRSFITYLFAAHVAEVEVDTQTGYTRVVRLTAAHDVGKAINPTLVEGQIQGGATQGIGMALMEEVVRKQGRVMNPSFTDYILPTIQDVPDIQAVIVERDDPGGPFGARGVGEPPLIGTPPAVLGAIADAVGRFPQHTPMSPERVWKLLNS